MAEVELTVRRSDPETGELIDAGYYSVENVPEGVARGLNEGHFNEVFPFLFAQYPDDFPSEEPGVDAEITGFEVYI